MATHRYLVDLLPWDAMISPGIVRHVDGALTAAVRYRGPALASATEPELQSLVATAERALGLLEDGWCLHVDAERLPAPPYPTSFAGPSFVRALDDQRRRAYEARPRFVTAQHLVLTWQPPTSLRADDAVREFRSRSAEVVDLLATIVDIERLGSYELYQYLYRCLTTSPEPITPRLGRLDSAVALEAILGVGDLEAGSVVRLAGRTIVPVSIAAFPAEIRAAALDWISNLDFSVRVSLRYIAQSPVTSRRALTRQRTRWSTRLSPKELIAAVVRGPGHSPADQVASEMARDADQALRDVEVEDLRTGWVSLVALTSAETRDQALVDAGKLVKAVRRHGYGAWRETFNALEAFLGTLPGETRSNVRRPVLTSRAVSHLAPLTSTWSGAPTHPLPALGAEAPPHLVVTATGGTPVSVSLSSTRLPDVQHTLIVGPSGAGKSVVLNLLLAQWLRYPGARIRSLDRGWSQLLLARALDAEHYSFQSSAKEGQRLAPLARIDTPEERQRGLEWLLDLFEATGTELTSDAPVRISEALDRLVATDRSLSTFALLLQDQGLRQALRPYMATGPYAHLFDGSRDSPLAGQVAAQAVAQVYEMGPLMSLPTSVVTPLLVHLMGDLEASLDGAPTLVAVEEVAGYLDRTYFARRFSRWLLEMRKANAGVVLVIQAIDQLLSSSLRSPVLEGCPTRLYLPNPAALEEPTRASYEAMGLSQRQIELIATATPRREYYLVTPDGSALVQLDLSPGALAVIGKAGPEAQELGRQWDLAGDLAEDRAEWLADYLGAVDEDLARAVRGRGSVRETPNG